MARGLLRWLPVRPVRLVNAGMQRLKVFVSSTFRDLQAERAAVESALHKLRGAQFVGMEHFGAHGGDATTVSLAQMQGCDLYVGVIGLARGSGITEREYRHALAGGVPCLIYQQQASDAEEDRLEHGLAALRREMRARHVVVPYTDPHELALRIVVDLHRELVQRLAARPVAGLVREAEQAIRLFVAEYAGGSAQAPAIFGGRDAELRQLDAWLDDPAAPRQAVLTAPAGRGKSALLVHWVQRLAARPDLHVLFFPISIRFGTHLAAQAYALLATRLAQLHGEPVAAADESAAEFWRGLLISLLMRPLPDGVQALVVIDGADEGGDWQPGPDLLPAHLPPGLRLLVSARHLSGDADGSGWLQRLGWSRPGQALVLDLRPLRPAGVVALLRSLSVPLERFSARADVVAELYRLSEGDPLLVKLYVADLWTLGDEVARLQPEDLRAIRPGLEGYFERWWADQRRLWGEQSPLREPAVNDLLNTLACALGPLGTELLLDLLPAESRLDLWSLDDTLQVLRRFIVGDGRQQGYVFGHPRLGDHFYERMQRAGRARRHEQRFVERGLDALDRVDDGRLDAAALPAYVPQFLRRHMERCGSPAPDLARLIAPAWLRAWEPLDRGSHTGFLADMQRAAQAVSAAAGQAAGAGQVADWPLVEMRATVYTSSVATLAADLAPPMLAVLARRGLWTPAQAIAQASRVPQRHRRLAALAWLATALEDDFRPLPLAAMLTDLKALAAAGDHAAELAAVVDGLRPPEAGDEPPAAHAARLVALAQAVRQLAERPRHALQDLLPDAALRHVPSETAPEAGAVVLQALLPWLDDAAAGLARAHLQRLQLQVRRADRPLVHALLAERLAVLRAVPAPAQAESPTLQQALLRTLLGLAVQDVSDGRQDALDQVLDLLPWLPADAAAVTARVGHALDAAGLARLLQATVQTGRPQRLAHLAAVLRHVPVADRVALQAACVDTLCDGAATAGTLLQDLVVLAPLLDAAVLGQVLDQPAVAAAAPALRLIALDQLVRAVDPPAQAALAARAWPLLTAPDATTRRALQDLASDPGLRDSLTPDADGATATPALVAALRRLLRWLDPQGRWRLPEPAPAAAVPADAAQRALLQRWDPAHGDLAANGDLVLLVAPSTIAADLPDLPLPDLLDWLAPLSSWVHRPALVQLVAEILEERSAGLGLDADLLLQVARAACAPALRPPAAATLQQLTAAFDDVCRRQGEAAGEALRQACGLALPDSLREAWALVGLRQARDAGDWRSMDTSWIEADWFEAMAFALVEPGDELVKTLLPRLCAPVAHAHHLPQALARQSGWAGAIDRLLLRRLLPLLARLPDAEPAPGHDAWSLAQAAHQPHRGGFWPAVLEAVRGEPSGAVRLAAITRLARHADAPALVQAVDLVTELRDPQQQLQAIAELAPRLPPTALGRLRDAVATLRRDGRVDAGAVPPALVPADDSAHRRALVAEALQHRSSAERQARLVQLQARLSDDDLRSAVARLQRLDDLVPRLLAIDALAARAAGGADEPAVQACLLALLQAMAPAAARHRAALLWAARLPASDRWGPLQAALAAGWPQDIDAAALRERLTPALHDAPAAVWQALVNAAGQPAEPAQHAWLRTLAPGMPAALLWLVQTRIGGTPAQWAWWVTPCARAELARWRHRARPLTRKLVVGLEALRAQRRIPAPDERHPPVDLARRLDACRGEPALARALRDWAFGQTGDPAELPLAVQALETLADPGLRAGALAGLALWAPPAAAADARRWLAAVAWPADRAWALLAWASRTIPNDPADLAALHGAALQALQAEPDREARNCLAAAWACRVPARVAEVLPLLVPAAPEDFEVDTLADLLPRLPDAAAAVLLQALPRLADPLLREHALSGLVPVPGPLAGQAALDVLATLPLAVARARVLVLLAPTLPDGLAPAAEAVLDGIGVDHAWLLALRAVGARFASAWTRARVHQAVALADAPADALVDDETRCAWLDAALPAWPADLQAGWLALLAPVADAGLRGELLAAAAARRPDFDSAGLLQAMRGLADPYQQAVAIGQLATLRGAPGLWPEVLADAARAGGRHVGVEALAAIASACRQVAPPLLDALLADPPRPPRGAAGTRSADAATDAALRHLAPWTTAAQRAALALRRPGLQLARPEDDGRNDPGAPHEPHRAPVDDAAPDTPDPADMPDMPDMIDLAAARARLAALLADPPPPAPAAPAPAPPVAPLARLRRLRGVASAGDRAGWARAALAAEPDAGVGRLLPQLRGEIDPRDWPALVALAWPRWLRSDPDAATAEALATSDADRRARLLAAAPADILAGQRARLHAHWRQRLDGLQQQPRAQLLAELGAMAPVIAALGGPGALPQAIDELQAVAALWP